MSNNNQHKPGYKHTPFGWIPNEWKIVSLGDIVHYKKGFAFKTDLYKTSGVRLIRVGDTNAQGIKENGNIYIDEASKAEYAEYELKTDDIIIQTVGSRPPLYHSMVGKTIIVTEQFAGSLLNQNAVRIREKDGYNIFLFSTLKQKRYLNYIETLVRGNANQVSITLEELFQFQILYPVNNSERNRIGLILSTWDEAITKTQQLIAQLQQRNKGLIQQLLSGKKRLKGFEGEEWKRLHATEIFKGVSIKNNGAERLLSATQDRGIIPRDMLEARVTMPTGETGSFKLVEIGDFVISLRSFQGGIEYSEYKGLVSPAYTVLKPTKQISNSFFKHYFKSYDFIGHLAVAVIGIRDGKQVSYEDFSILKLPYPSIEEQEAIAKVVDAAVAEVKLQEQRLAVLQQQKKGLMQKLLTGEVRVKFDSNQN